MSYRSVPRTDQVAMRRQIILDDLRRHPLSSTREISDRILEETGGAPVLLTGAIFIPAWTLYADLAALEKQGKVYKFKSPETRAASWQVAEEA